MLCFGLLGWLAVAAGIAALPAAVAERFALQLMAFAPLSSLLLIKTPLNISLLSRVPFARVMRFRQFLLIVISSTIVTLP
jgi:hypothetical protein